MMTVVCGVSVGGCVVLIDQVGCVVFGVCGGYVCGTYVQ